MPKGLFHGPDLVCSVCGKRSLSGKYSRELGFHLWCNPNAYNRGYRAMKKREDLERIRKKYFKELNEAKTSDPLSMIAKFINKTIVKNNPNGAYDFREFVKLLTDEIKSESDDLICSQLMQIKTVFNSLDKL